MEPARPTIKGIFVNSHINRVRVEKGEDGLKRLEETFGRPLTFRNSEDVYIRDEVKLIECALDILSDPPVPPEKRAFEAGRLHFRNFTTTPLAKIIFSLFRTNFKLMMLQSNNIAGHVFQGIKFHSEDMGEKHVKLTMTNNDYPIDHFQGLFYEWMLFAGLTGQVRADTGPNQEYIYTMTWE